MGKVVGVRFQRGCKVYDFDAGHFVLNRGDMVIVETEQGLALGQVARPPQAVAADPDAKGGQALKSVYRMATDDDLAQLKENAELEKEAHRRCLECIADRKLAMNLVKVECLFDRSKIIFYFTADGRLDFRELVRDLVARLRTRVEMRQIGVRHEAKLLGGLGSCGRELCCATFLKDFEPVSVKMAKEQNLSLNPTKISGLCGRLMCCLTYEFQVYKELKKGLPKMGKRLKLEDGLEVKVVRQNVLERLVTVYTNDGREITCTPEELAELKPLHPMRPRPEPAQRNKRPPAQERKSKPRGRRRRSKKGSQGQ
jgi:cell fate regulator YaaT (PSP1 superfamily)